jgi:hypothetical protein
VTIEDRIKVVEVMALAMDPPAVFDVETSLREVIHRMRDDDVNPVIPQHKNCNRVSSQ